MKISEVSVRDLNRMLRAAERALGPDAPSAVVLRRELTRRHNLATEGNATLELVRRIFKGTVNEND